MANFTVGSSPTAIGTGDEHLKTEPPALAGGAADWVAAAAFLFWKRQGTRAKLFSA